MLSWMLVTVSSSLLYTITTIWVFHNTDTKLNVILLLNIVILLPLINGAGDSGAQLQWPQRVQTDFKMHIAVTTRVPAPNTLGNAYI